VIVAQANHNAKEGMYGERFKTDADGRFEITGLPNYPQGFELAFLGSFEAPYASRRKRVVPGEDAQVQLTPALPYRLKLVDPKGKPLDREIYSIVVQESPGATRHDIKMRFNDAQRVAPGVYEGIVPMGPGAVLVKRKKADRPVAVDPKAFFAPGRKDWTPEEMRFAYGDAWRIAHPAVITTEALGVSPNWTTDQLELAAVVFTNAKSNDRALELTATVHSDPPVEVTLVDEAGKPVKGARVERQLKRYDEKGLPASFSVHGLHPERAEMLIFTHDTRGLIGVLSTTWTSEPVRVVVQPSATVIGRIVNAKGEPDHDFGIRVFCNVVMPDTVVAGRMFNTTKKPGERTGEFRLTVPPGVEVRGEWVRKGLDQLTRPSAGAAFGPLVPKSGETQLGDLSAP
jgi:hypothetical protein